MKLEKGLYVRTDKGFISQIKEFKEHYTKGKRLVTSSSVKEVDENYISLRGNQCDFIDSIDYSIPPCYPSDEEIEKIKRHIVKASFNVIDILEVKDIIEIDVIDEDNYSHILGINFIRIENERDLSNIKDMISNESAKLIQIVTHEQMEQISYKLGE